MIIYMIRQHWPHTNGDTVPVLKAHVAAVQTDCEASSLSFSPATQPTLLHLHQLSHHHHRDIADYFIFGFRFFFFL